MLNKAIIIDINGTIITSSNKPIKGAINWFKQLEKIGRKVVFMTNNTKLPPDLLCEHLCDIGFNCKPAQIVSPMASCVETLKSINVQTAYVIGNENLSRYLISQGIDTSKNDTVDAVVVGDDPHFTPDKLSKAMNHLFDGSHFLALHKKRFSRGKDNKLVMDVGGPVAALEYATNRIAHIVGKPSHDFYQVGATLLGLDFDEISVISDDPFSDLIKARHLSMTTFFVCTGTYEDDSILIDIPFSDRPHYTYQSIADIPVY